MNIYNINYVSKKNLKQTEIDIEKDYFSGKKLKIREYPYGIIASSNAGGPGVFYKDKYIKDSDFTNSVKEEREVNKSNLRYSDEEVVFIGTLAGIYGHMITDNLKHLWILLNDNNKLRNLKFVYTQYKTDEPVNDVFFQICEMLGKPRSEITKLSDACRFSKVYIPDQCFFCEPVGDLEQSGDRYYTEEYRRIIKKIKDAVPDFLCNFKRIDKIYFTRTRLRNTYRDFGEKYIENTFRELGYEIVSPETLKFEEQIFLLKNCRKFATTQGSVSLNAIFCNQDATVLLINKQNYNTPYQLAINHARGVKSL